MIVDIALPIPVGKSFSYSVPEDFVPYMVDFLRVLAPFHNKEAVGVVVAIRDGHDPKLKAIKDIVDPFPLADKRLLSLIEWSSSHYIAQPGLVFKYALPPFTAVERFLVVATNDPKLANIKDMPLKKAVYKIGRRNILCLCREGSISLRDILTSRTFSPVLGRYDVPALDTSQEKILFVDSIEKRLKYYKSLISAHLQIGRNVMILLPDYYAGGAFFTKRFEETYGHKVLWFSSATPLRQKMETYFRVRRAGGNLILGNKNCVFLPVRDLSMIIIERSEDDEYKNEEGFKFNPVRLAVEKAALHNASIVLGSGACSVDILHLANVEGFKVNLNEWVFAGRYTEKTTNREMSSTGDLLEELTLSLRQVVSEGMRAAVYTPRKDLGGFLRCHACSEQVACPGCGGYLSYDRERDNMLCLRCAGHYPYRENCPFCGSSMIGFGRIGVEFIEEHLRRSIPDVSVIRITGDSLKKGLSTIRRIAKREPVVLVGTQSLSKLYGFHVNKLIFADWEELRKMGGYKSEEKAHQIITNLIDALTPEDIVCFSKKKESLGPEAYYHISSFCEKELRKRKDADFPPFTRIFLVLVRKKTFASADATLSKIRSIISEEGVDGALFGAVPVKKPPFCMWKVVLKGNEQLLRNIFKRLYDIPGVEIEADPASF